MRVLLTLLMAVGIIGCATQRDYTAGTSPVCEVHYRMMEKTVVPMQFPNL